MADLVSHGVAPRAGRACHVHGAKPACLLPAAAAVMRLESVGGHAVGDCGAGDGERCGVLQARDRPGHSRVARFEEFTEIGDRITDGWTWAAHPNQRMARARMSHVPAVAGVGRAQDRSGASDGDAMVRVGAADVNEAGRDRIVLEHPAAGWRRGGCGWRGCGIRGRRGLEGHNVALLGAEWHRLERPARRVRKDGASHGHQGDNRHEERRSLPADSRPTMTLPTMTRGAHAGYNSAWAAGLAALRECLGADRGAQGEPDGLGNCPVRISASIRVCVPLPEKPIRPITDASVRRWKYHRPLSGSLFTSCQAPVVRLLS